VALDGAVVCNRALADRLADQRLKQAIAQALTAISVTP
jgi:hypothetical protein